MTMGDMTMGGKQFTAKWWLFVRTVVSYLVNNEAKEITNKSQVINIIIVILTALVLSTIFMVFTDEHFNSL